MWVNPFWFGFLIGMLTALVVIVLIGKAISRQEEKEEEEENEQFRQFMSFLESNAESVKFITMEGHNDDESDSQGN